MGTKWLALCLIMGAASTSAQIPDRNTTFESAFMKLSDRTSGRGCTGGPGTSTPGQYTCFRANIDMLLALAFNLKPYQRKAGREDTDARRVTTPLSTPSGFDLVAKLPADTTREQFRIMLQNLLIDRLKLAYHFERHSALAYTLTVAKKGSKLTTSASEDRSGASLATSASSARRMPVPSGFPAPRHGDTATIIAGSVVRIAASNVGMDQIVAMLTKWTNAPIVDATRFRGKYDFTLEFTPVSTLSVDSAADDESFGSLPSALQDQLGLTLKKDTAMIEFFVIDHIEKEPVEN